MFPLTSCGSFICNSSENLAIRVGSRQGRSFFGLGSALLPVDFDRGVGTHFGAHAAGRALAIALEFGGMIPLSIQLLTDNDAFVRAGFNAEAAALNVPAAKVICAVSQAASATSILASISLAMIDISAN